MKFAIDMMGGDNGSLIIVESILEFASKHPEDIFYCVGNVEELGKIKDVKNIIIIPSKTVLRMDIEPMEALHDKESSLFITVDTFLKEQCDAIISAGSTGAILTLATLKIKRIPGITRPGLITPFPTYKKNKKFVCIDLGANTVNTKEELHQFAQMGSIYYSFMYNDAHPKVGLLNIGTEEEKGNDLRKETYQLLKNDPSINFIGNVEGKEPLYGNIDVLVTDGFSGNIFLKTTEGSCKVMSLLIKDAFKKNLLTKIGYLFSKKGFDELKERMDYKNVGGAMLMGVNGIVVKAHGNSDFKSFTSALNICYDLAKKDIIKQIKEALQSK